MKSSLLFLAKNTNNPFEALETFLMKDVVEGLLDIATPIAVLAFIGVGIGALISQDEHARQKFKTGLWWTGLAAALCFFAKNIVKWLDAAF